MKRERLDSATKRAFKQGRSSQRQAHHLEAGPRARTRLVRRDVAGLLQQGAAAMIARSITDTSSLAFIVCILEDQRDSALTDGFRESCIEAIEVAKRLMKQAAKTAVQVEAVP